MHTSKRIILKTTAIIIFIGFGFNSFKTQVPGNTTVKAKYLGNYPSDRKTGWNEDLQGVAHDLNNWYFTQKIKIWKFPISRDLKKSISKNNLPTGIKSVTMLNRLRKRGYNHFGDLVQYKGYLFIPVEAEKGTNTKNPLLVVYKASTLTYIGAARLLHQTKAGWCAVNPENGLLYSSNNHLTRENQLISYNIDFRALQSNKLDIQYQGIKKLYGEDGKLVKMKRYIQGGTFSSEGKFIFLLNGRESSATPAGKGGIWIFDTESGKFIQKSATSGYFRYEYHPGMPNLEEPEGLTYWELDKRNAPHIKGNLHAILLNNNIIGSDKFWLKHYQIDFDK